MHPCNPPPQPPPLPEGMRQGEQGSDATLAVKGVGGGDKITYPCLSYSDLKSNEIKIGQESYLCCLVLFSLCLFVCLRNGVERRKLNPKLVLGEN